MGHTAVRAVEVEVSGDSARLLKRGAAPLDPAVWDDPGGAKDQISHAVKQAMSAAGITATHVVASLPRRLVTIKYANLPTASHDDMRDMVAIDAQQYIPFPIDEVVLDHQIVSETGDDMATVMIVAARRLMVEDLLSAFDRAGLEVTLLSVSSLGLAEHARTSMLPEALLEVESGEIDLAVVGGGRLLFTRAASLLESADTPGGIHILAGEVVRSLSAYQNENRGHPVTKLLVASQNGQLEAIQDALGGVLEAPITRLNGSLMPVTDPDALSYATASGLALQSEGGLSRISLIPSSRAERKVAARKRVQSVLAVALVLVVIAAAGMYVKDWMHKGAVERAAAIRENAKLDYAKQKLADSTSEHDKISKEYAVVSIGLMRPSDTVDLLKAVSDSLPKNGGVYLSQLTYDRMNALSIKGNANNDDAATDFALNLQKQAAFSQVRLNYLGDAQTMLASAVSVAGKPAAGAAAPAAKQSASTFIITCTARGVDKLKPAKSTGAARSVTTTSLGGGQ